MKEIKLDLCGSNLDRVKKELNEQLDKDENVIITISLPSADKRDKDE